MANLLWGKVYFNDMYAGILREEAGYRYSFTYEEEYVNENKPQISYTLPLRREPYISELNLHPFFDNLVAEGWLEDAQRRLIGKRMCSRFELLLAFGTDLAGAVTVIDPEPTKLHSEMLDLGDPKNIAVFKNRASLSGIQPKVLLTTDNKQLRPTNLGEISTHIAKLPSESIQDITYNEWITLNACKALLPDDDFVEAEMKEVKSLGDEVLLIKRFDRTDHHKIHFEEFTQLLGLQSDEKYDGAYEDMAKFIYNVKLCLPAEAYKLYKRILVALLTGNTDMHFKNFSMIHSKYGLRLAPNYDQVSAAIYKLYQTVALRFDGASDRVIGNIKPKNIIALGKEYSLSDDVIMMAVEEVGKHLSTAKDVVNEVTQGASKMKDDIIKFMERRWRGSFSLIGQQLSKKQ